MAKMSDVSTDAMERVDGATLTRLAGWLAG